ncbi:uncharacterized protein N7515_005846 [Penicillium bovifimosum]|uniref:Uncharacterized protein n=1 Tax=Penicillium bovifimosum TaxID=126998 RepID=A0A9W9GTM6_9EURO|nr:uncharacterized protein N7515_005846 [Penicillium bovifimosum]KAJ5129807.1 hypothetical protein N7515_005846 [Penicillium bovifimosum]
MAPIPGSDHVLLSRKERNNEADEETGMLFVYLIFGSLLAALALAAGYLFFKKCVRPKLKARRRDGWEKSDGPPLKVIEGKEPARPESAHVAGHEKQAEVDRITTDLTEDYMRKSTVLMGSR